MRTLHTGKHQGGMILLVVILFIAVSSVASSALVVSHETESRRQREEQLLFAGDQFRQAIQRYYNTVPPGGTRSLPRSLDDLIEDRRFTVPVRHLRRIYLDPMTGRADWQFVNAGQGIIAVHSSSQREVLKTRGFPKGYEQFEGARTYADWIFAAR